MDQETQLPLTTARLSRRQLLKYGAVSAGCAAGLAGFGYVCRNALATTAEIFPGDAPAGRLWEQWQRRGWAKEARYTLALGQNIQCRLCPNGCILGPGDRSRCRNRVHKDGKLYTLAYGNPCAFHVDPVEKKPLFHFFPGTATFSIATTGCGFRCLNCQNWDISQRKPEELKDSRGEEVRATSLRWSLWSQEELDRLSMFPEDVVALTQFLSCPSVSYTYSEPTVWYEYMFDTAKAAKEKGLKNICVTCGYIEQEPLKDLCQVVDAMHVDLKGFSEDTYGRLNSGRLAPVLSTMRTLKAEGVWFEVINLVVPTYTDSLDTIRRMCDWLVKNIGPDYPLHFSRFLPMHKLTHLPPTPSEVLVQAREAAKQSGLNFVYIGNIRDIPGAETTTCPGCGKAIIERETYAVTGMHIAGGRCSYCDREIPGVWS